MHRLRRSLVPFSLLTSPSAANRVMEHRLRRTLLLFSLGCSALLAAVAPVSARQAGSELADLGLPELEVAVTADAFEGIPDQLEAGRYLVTVTAGEDAGEEGGGVSFVQPVGLSADEFLELAAGPPDVANVEGTPELTAEGAPPADGEEMGGPPPEFYDFVFAGGTYAPPGETAEIVLDLTPGEWVAWGDDPEAPQEPVVFAVTGEMPTDLSEPASSATLTMSEMEITVSEGALTSGQQIVKVENLGAQPHFIVMFKGPDGFTEEQAAVVLDEEMQAEMTGTPPAYSGINPEEDLMPVAFTATQSTDTALWLSLDLEPGTYGLVCFFPDIADGTPHAYKGMYAVVEVAS